MCPHVPCFLDMPLGWPDHSDLPATTLHLRCSRILNEQTCVRTTRPFIAVNPKLECCIEPKYATDSRSYCIFSIILYIGALYQHQMSKGGVQSPSGKGMVQLTPSAWC